MNLYVIGIIIFSLVVVACIFLLVYYIKDERKLKEVTNQELMQLGKVYSKQEFEEKMFQQYVNILENIQYANYNFLKDAVSDDIYNQILLKVKNNKDQNVEDVITNIQKDFSKLISFGIMNDLEVAKVWIRYSSIEYVKGIRSITDEEGKEVVSEVVVQGNKDKAISHEYILTFVKNKTQTENIVCPSCGYQTHLLTSSKCIRCDSEIVPKKMHWVFVNKVTTNISNQK